MQNDPISADDLATGAILRMLTMRVARLENPQRPSDAFDEIRDCTVRAIGNAPISDATPATAIRIRAHAQVVTMRLLELADA